MTQARGRISLVIPARNEAVLLPRLLDSVDAARARDAGADAVEVIVADNDSTDDTADIARRRGCRVVGVATRNIAAVRNGGAAIAGGEWLAFVDADMQIHPDTFTAIASALGNESVVGGASGIRPERWSVGIAVAYAVTTIAARLTGFEAGLTFCRRSDFEAMGGYDERRSSLEDVEFLVRLKRLGAGRRQRLARLHGAPCIFSTRKFDQYGDWHWLALGLRVIRARAWRRDVRIAAVQTYWYAARDGAGADAPGSP